MLGTITKPVAVNRATATLQGESETITAYMNFPGRSHHTLGQAGWEEVADYALAWALHPAEIALPV